MIIIYRLHNYYLNCYTMNYHHFFFYFSLLFLVIISIYDLDETSKSNYANFLQSFDKTELIQWDLMHHFFLDFIHFLLRNNISFLRV